MIDATGVPYFLHLFGSGTPGYGVPAKRVGRRRPTPQVVTSAY
ncbi:MAG: hypothetical protein ACE5HP_02090 [Gemmatimonadota bacterium]